MFDIAGLEEGNWIGHSDTGFDMSELLIVLTIKKSVYSSLWEFLWTKGSAATKNHVWKHII